MGGGEHEEDCCFLAGVGNAPLGGDPPASAVPRCLQERGPPARDHGAPEGVGQGLHGGRGRQEILQGLDSPNVGVASPVSSNLGVGSPVSSNLGVGSPVSSNLGVGSPVSSNGSRFAVADCPISDCSTKLSKIGGVGLAGMFNLNYQNLKP